MHKARVYCCFIGFFLTHGTLVGSAKLGEGEPLTQAQESANQGEWKEEIERKVAALDQRIERLENSLSHNASLLRAGAREPLELEVSCTPLWEFFLDQKPLKVVPHFIENQCIVLYENKVVCLNEDGELVWELENKPSTFCTFSENGSFYFLAQDRQTLCCIDHGEQVLERKISDMRFFPSREKIISLSICADMSKVFLLSDKRSLFKCECNIASCDFSYMPVESVRCIGGKRPFVFVLTKGGDLYRYNMRLKKMNIIASSLIVDSVKSNGKDSIFARSKEGEFVCFNLQGEKTWAFRLPKKNKRFSFCFLSDQEDVYFFDRRSQELLIFDLGGDSVTSQIKKIKIDDHRLFPFGVDEFGVLYFYSKSGCFYSIDKEGNVQKTATNKKITMTPVLHRDRKIIFCTKDGVVYGLDMES